MTATGGLLIVAIGINLLELTKIRIGNLIPALVLAILWGFGNRSKDARHLPPGGADRHGGGHGKPEPPSPEHRPGNASLMTFTARDFHADECLRMGLGLLCEVCDTPESLLERSLNLAAEIAANPQSAVKGERRRTDPFSGCPARQCYCRTGRKKRDFSSA